MAGSIVCFEDVGDACFLCAGSSSELVDSRLRFREAGLFSTSDNGALDLPFTEDEVDFGEEDGVRSPFREMGVGGAKFFVEIGSNSLVVFNKVCPDFS